MIIAAGASTVQGSKFKLRSLNYKYSCSDKINLSCDVKKVSSSSIAAVSGCSARYKGNQIAITVCARLHGAIRAGDEYGASTLHVD